MADHDQIAINTVLQKGHRWVELVCEHIEQARIAPSIEALTAEPGDWCVVGSGPSIAHAPWDYVRKCSVVCCDAATKHMPFDPDYVITCEESPAASWNTIRTNSTVLLPLEAASEMWAMWADAPAYWWTSTSVADIPGTQLDWGANVGCCGISFAERMNARSITLVGMDHEPGPEWGPGIAWQNTFAEGHNLWLCDLSRNPKRIGWGNPLPESPIRAVVSEQIDQADISGWYDRGLRTIRELANSLHSITPDSVRLVQRAVESFHLLAPWVFDLLLQWQRAQSPQEAVMIGHAIRRRVTELGDMLCANWH